MCRAPRLCWQAPKHVWAVPSIRLPEECAGRGALQHQQQDRDWQGLVRTSGTTCRPGRGEGGRGKEGQRTVAQPAACSIKYSVPVVIEDLRPTRRAGSGRPPSVALHRCPGLAEECDGVEPRGDRRQLGRRLALAEVKISEGAMATTSSRPSSIGCTRRLPQAARG
jgi:hypothetical protein